MRKEMSPQPPEEPAMNKQTNTQQQKQNANVWIKLAVLLVIVFSTAALLITYVYISKLRDTNRDLQQQAMELEEDNQNLQDYIDHKDTDEGVKDVATGELGMVDPDTVIYDFD
jgi:cell division protein FtsB